MSPSAASEAASPAGIIVPPGWWAIPLRDPATRRASVATLVRRQFATTPAPAQLRAQMVAQLNRLASDAAAADGYLFAMSTLVADGVAIPMSLTVFRPRFPGGLRDVTDSLRGQPDVVVAQGVTGDVIRRVTTVEPRTRTDATPAGTSEFSETPVAMLKVDYWLDPADGLGLFHVVYTSPLVEAREQLLELFDDITSTVEAPGEGDVEARLPDESA